MYVQEAVVVISVLGVMCNAMRLLVGLGAVTPAKALLCRFVNRGVTKISSKLFGNWGFARQKELTAS